MVAAAGTGQERPAFSTDRQSHPSMSARRHGPTTPLRRVSRGSFSKGQTTTDGFPLNSLEPAFAELADALTDLNANFEQLQDMHNSLARFSESFASFLYGLNMNAFCNEFPQAPTIQSFKRNEGCLSIDALNSIELKQKSLFTKAYDEARTAPPDMTMTTDTSFVEKPMNKPLRTPSQRGAPRGRGRGTRGRGSRR